MFLSALRASNSYVRQKVKNTSMDIRLLEAYAYYKVTKYDFRLSKILIFRLNFSSSIY